MTPMTGTSPGQGRAPFPRGPSAQRMRALRMTELTHDIHHGALDPTALPRTLQAHILTLYGERLGHLHLQVAQTRLGLQSRILLGVTCIGRMKARMRVSES